jgi:hypothetical protein
MELFIHRTEDHDWVELTLDGKEFHKGHEVPDHVWVELLRKAGVEVSNAYFEQED